MAGSPYFCPMLRILLLLLVGTIPLTAQEDPHAHLRDGDAAYLAEDYAEAELAYRRAINAAPSGQAQYNLGNTLYQNSRYDEAMQAYAAAAATLDTPTNQASAYYNLGNAAAAQENWQEAVDAYRNALRIEPNDTATKYNYAQALERLRQQQQEQQEQEQQQENEEGEGEENQEEQEQQEGENQEQEEQQSGEGEGEEEQPQDPQEGEGEEEGQRPQEQEIDNDAQSQPAQAVSLSRQQAEELLKIIEREEQKVQEKIRKGQATGRRSDKDW